MSGKEQDQKSRAAKKLRAAEHLMRRAIERSVAGTGVYRGQHQMLMNLYFLPDCTQAALAERMEVSPAAVAVGLKKLEKAGYVQRISGEKDNRSRRLVLTPKGQRLVDESIAMFRRLDEYIFQDFSGEELKTLEGMLDRICTNLSGCGNLCGRREDMMSEHITEADAKTADINETDIKEADIKEADIKE